MNNIYIYLLNNIDIINSYDESFIAENIVKMPRSRQEKCNKYRRFADKQLCILSYLLLKQGLHENYSVNIDVENEFGFNKYGKPYLKDYPSVYFNISHCRNAVVCAVADIEIGVDIQNISSFGRLNIDNAKTICTLSELTEICRSTFSKKSLCRLWTMKESYAKLKGIGILNIIKKDLPDNCKFTNYENDKFSLSCAFECDSNYALSLKTLHHIDINYINRSGKSINP